MKVCFIFFIFIFIHENAGLECNTPLSSEAKLREKLFCNYDKMVRPVKYFANQTLVQFQLFPNKIYLDEHQEVILFQGSILYVWTDHFLKWDPREYEGIDFIVVSSKDIWVPDISIDTWLQSTTSLSMTTAPDCRLEHSGGVYCFIMTSFQAPCTPDITTYPFDTQNCTLLFSSFSFVGKHINFTLFDPKNGIKMSLYQPNRFWELTTATAQREVNYFTMDNESAFYPLIKCEFLLKRHAAGHSAIVILPAAVLAGLSLFVFWMDDMYSTRIGISSMVIICDVLYCLYLGVMLPSNGNRIPILVTFYRDSFLIASFGIIVTVFVRHLRLRSRPPSHWVSDTLLKMESIKIVQMFFLGEKSFKEEDSVEIIENAKKSSSAWDQVATLVDRVSFFLCCSTYAILLMFYLP